MCVCVCATWERQRGCLLPRHLSLHRLASVPTTSQLSLLALHTLSHTHIHTHTHTQQKHAPALSLTRCVLHCSPGQPRWYAWIELWYSGTTSQTWFDFKGRGLFWLWRVGVRVTQCLLCTSDVRVQASEVLTGSDVRSRSTKHHDIKMGELRSLRWTICLSWTSFIRSDQQKESATTGTSW